MQGSTFQGKVGLVIAGQYHPGKGRHGKCKEVTSHEREARQMQGSTSQERGGIVNAGCIFQKKGCIGNAG